MLGLRGPNKFQPERVWGSRPFFLGSVFEKANISLDGSISPGNITGLLASPTVVVKEQGSRFGFQGLGFGVEGDLFWLVVLGLSVLCLGRIRVWTRGWEQPKYTGIRYVYRYIHQFSTICIIYIYIYMYMYMDIQY